jgi:hypothetical protein
MMPNPAAATALIFDALVRGAAVAATPPDIALALQEFSLGQPTASRPLDVCFGFGPSDPASGFAAPLPVVSSRGLARASGALIADTSQTSLDLTALLGSTPVKDAFAFGSVYAVFSHPQGYAASLTIQPVIVRGGSTGSGAPLLMARTVAAEDAASWLRDGLVPPTIPPSGTSLELWRWVLDVDSFDPAAASSKQVSVVSVDLRRPRGAFGFAEEVMASVLVPAAIDWTLSASDDQASLDAAIVSAVGKWVVLPTWSPTFVDYWAASSVALPTALAAFLSSRLGIVIP